MKLRKTVYFKIDIILEQNWYIWKFIYCMIRFGIIRFGKWYRSFGIRLFGFYPLRSTTASNKCQVYDSHFPTYYYLVKLKNKVFFYHTIAPVLVSCEKKLDSKLQGLFQKLVKGELKKELFKLILIDNWAARYEHNFFCISAAYMLLSKYKSSQAACVLK